MKSNFILTKNRDTSEKEPKIRFDKMSLKRGQSSKATTILVIHIFSKP